MAKVPQFYQSTYKLDCRNGIAFHSKTNGVNNRGQITIISNNRENCVLTPFLRDNDHRLFMLRLGLTHDIGNPSLNTTWTSMPCCAEKSRTVALGILEWDWRLQNGRNHTRRCRLRCIIVKDHGSKKYQGIIFYWRGRWCHWMARWILFSMGLVIWLVRWPVRLENNRGQSSVFALIPFI